jgi:hypothetical protein
MHKLYGGMGKLLVTRSSHVCKPIGHTLQESIVIKNFSLEKFSCKWMCKLKITI